MSTELDAQAARAQTAYNNAIETHGPCSVQAYGALEELQDRQGDIAEIAVQEDSNKRWLKNALAEAAKPV